jgi:hypothetical protein
MMLYSVAHCSMCTAVQVAAVLVAPLNTLKTLYHAGVAATTRVLMQTELIAPVHDLSSALHAYSVYNAGKARANLKCY